MREELVVELHRAIGSFLCQWPNSFVDWPSCGLRCFLGACPQCVTVSSFSDDKKAILLYNGIGFICTSGKYAHSCDDNILTGKGETT